MPPKHDESDDATKPVEVPAYVHKGLAAEAKRTEISQKAIVGRVLWWYLRQDVRMRGIIIGELPDAMRPDFARMLLAKIASGEGEAAESEDKPGYRAAGHAARRKAQKEKSSDSQKRTGEAG